ncbi:MAG TPA: hypothetical protein PLV42_08935 [bacterium]|nr:hypothetical protein [bacterium]
MRILLFILCIAAAALLRADPLLVKGADGTYLPILAESWNTKSGGVLIKLKKGLDAAALKDKLAEKLPDQTVELRSGNIYFASVELDALLHAVAGVDTGVTLKFDPIALLREKKESADSITATPGQKEIVGADEFAEAELHSISFSGVDGLAKLEVTVRVGPVAGEFAKLKGPIKAKTFFKMKKTVADIDDEDNQRKADLLVARPKSLIYLRIEKKEEDGTYLITEAHLKKY